jgi:hypothetical protein
MAITKMFRDRVVSMEQTFELGEKYLDLLSDLVTEAFPGSSVLAHELEAESDLFLLTAGEVEGPSRRIRFTRMILSDATCVPAIAADRAAPVRDRLVEALRSQAQLGEVTVTFRHVMGDDDRLVGEEVDAEWRQREEAAAAARRVEEQRRAEEKRRQREIEAARHKARREKQRGAAPAGKVAPAPPQVQGAPGTGKKRRRRGRGGQGAPGGPGQQPQQARPAIQQQGPGQQGAPQQGGPRPPHQPRHQQPRQQAGPPQPHSPQQSPAPRPPQEGAAPGAAEGSGGRKRKRRRRRGGGGGPAGAGPTPGGAGGGGVL